MAVKITKGKKVDLSKAALDAGLEGGIKRLYGGLEWTTGLKDGLDLDVIAIACKAPGTAINSESVNFFGQRSSSCGGVNVSKDNRTGEDAVEPNEYGLTHDECVMLDLMKLPAEVTHVDILLHCFEEPKEIERKKKATPAEAILSFGDCDDAFVELIDLDLLEKDADKAGLARLDLAFDASEACTINFGKVMRRGEGWAWVPTAAENMEIVGGLGDILTGYGWVEA